MYRSNGYIWITWQLTWSMPKKSDLLRQILRTHRSSETHKKYNEERKKKMMPNFYILEINPCGPTFASNACFTNWFFFLLFDAETAKPKDKRALFTNCNKNCLQRLKNLSSRWNYSCKINGFGDLSSIYYPLCKITHLNLARFSLIGDEVIVVDECAAESCLLPESPQFLKSNSSSCFSFAKLNHKGRSFDWSPFQNFNLNFKIMDR